jgi:hypothetical protein
LELATPIFNRFRASGLDTRKQFRQGLLQTLGYLSDIHERHISNSALNTAVIRSVQSASLGGFFLIDLLFLAYAADGAAKSDADIEGHMSGIRTYQALRPNALPADGS